MVCAVCVACARCAQCAWVCMCVGGVVREWCGAVRWCGVSDDTHTVGAIPMISFNFNMGYAFVHGCSPLLSWHAFTPWISAKVLSGKQLRDVGPFWAVAPGSRFCTTTKETPANGFLCSLLKEGPAEHYRNSVVLFLAVQATRCRTLLFG